MGGCLCAYADNAPETKFSNLMMRVYSFLPRLAPPPKKKKKMFLLENFVTHIIGTCQRDSEIPQGL